MCVIGEECNKTERFGTYLGASAASEFVRARGVALQPLTIQVLNYGRAEARLKKARTVLTVWSDDVNFTRDGKPTGWR